MGMVLRPSSGTIEYSPEHFGANVLNEWEQISCNHLWECCWKDINFLTIHHTLCSTYIASYLDFVFLVETSVLLPANDAEAFACAFIYCKCMLVISKPFVLAQIWKQIWKAQGLIRISYATCLIYLLYFTWGGLLNAPDASKVTHIVSLKLQ
jgi:hypothetical protein